MDDRDFERAATVLEEGYDLLGSEKIYNMIGELVEEAEAARIAEEEEQAQQSQYSYDEIPLWIQAQEMTVFRSGVPSIWSAAERA